MHGKQAMFAYQLVADGHSWRKHRNCPNCCPAPSTPRNIIIFVAEGPWNIPAVGSIDTDAAHVALLRDEGHNLPNHGGVMAEDVDQIGTAICGDARLHRAH